MNMNQVVSALTDMFREPLRDGEERKKNKGLSYAHQRSSGNRIDERAGNCRTDWSMFRRVVIGNMTVGGTISKVEDLAIILQICVDTGAKKVLIPASSVVDLQTVPPDLLVKVQPVFYADPIDEMFKGWGVI